MVFEESMCINFCKTGWPTIATYTIPIHFIPLKLSFYEIRALLLVFRRITLAETTSFTKNLLEHGNPEISVHFLKILRNFLTNVITFILKWNRFWTFLIKKQVFKSSMSFRTFVTKTCAGSEFFQVNAPKWMQQC